MKPFNKILYVDDQQDIQSIAKLALEKIGGFTVKLCSSGRQTLDEMESFSPDLFLLDVMMPSMDGPQTLIEIRKTPQFELTPVIFMTANIKPDEIKDYLSMGVIGVIKKPFEVMTLANEVESLRRKSQNEF